MSISNQVPESSMEEILASIRKIISEDESKPSDSRVRSTPPAPEPGRHSDNVSPLFADRADVTRFGSDRPAAGRAAPAIGRVPPDQVRDTNPAHIRPTAAGEGHPTGAVPSPQPLESPSPIQGNDRQLLSPDAEAAVSASFEALQGKAPFAGPRAVERMAEDLMRPMVKAWLDQYLPALVERLVRAEIERLSHNR